ncbi:UbiH/UbiF/VisC/COQ6 family ubiquinone biosynthesis hydroxylase [Alkalilimnicola ehrlichii]|nr:UbiH/UbiF/VisC/COQ6 family ubiquinone biosynthesis hydroxylase [Alkalilimnicola ehrlichii]
MLRAVGCWEAMSSRRVSPFDAIEVRDSESGAQLHFDGAAIGAAHLGHIVENSLTQTVLYDRVAAAGNIELIVPGAVERVRHRSDERLALMLEDGRTLLTRLLVGADGAASKVRVLAGIECEQVSYGQVGIVGSIATERVHGEVARQRFLPGGPLAFLPLADGRCSIVWSVPEAERDRLLALTPDAFCAELTEASGEMLGAVQSVGERAAFPLRKQHAKRYVDDRIALIGDAAHVIHPLAGQGINLGFLDAASLAEVVSDAAKRGRDIGGLAVLRRYERWRKGDNLLMQRAMDGFHLLFGTRNPLVVGMRGLGLELTERLPPAKSLYMRHAMGLGGDLPALAKV